MTSISDLEAFERTLDFLERSKEDPALNAEVSEFLRRANGTNPQSITDMQLDKLEALVGGKLIDDGTLPVISLKRGKGLVFSRNLLRNATFFKTQGRLPRVREDYWLREMRVKADKGTLEPAFEQALSLIFGSWRENSTKKLRTENAFSRNIAFIKKHGRLPSSDEDQWLFSQYRKLNKGNLDDALRERLNTQIPNWIEVGETIQFSTFEESLARVKAFLEQEGRLPMVCEDRWLGQIRDRNRLGEIGKEQLTRLDTELPGWKEGKKIREEACFSKALERNVTFLNKYGRLPTRSEDQWIGTQKTKLSRGQLSKAQVNALNHSLPGWQISRSRGASKHKESTAR